MKKLSRIFKITILMAFVFMMAGCGKTKIDLNKYVTLEATGYDSLGTVTATVDFDALYNDYGKKLKFNGKKLSQEQKSIIALAYSGEDGAFQFLKDFCVFGSLENKTNLNNGDTILFKWDCEDELALNALNCELSYEDISYPVTGLTRLEEYDPFAHAEIQFDEWGVLTINEDSDPEMQEITLELDKNAVIKNGSTVVVYAKIDNPEAFAEKYGEKLGSDSKEFTLSGIMEYLDSAKAIPQNNMEQMIQYGQEMIKKAYEEDDDSAYKILDSAEYLGNYYLRKKPDAEQPFFGQLLENQVILVYEVKSHILFPQNDDGWGYSWDEGWNLKLEENNTIHYYCAIVYNNIAVDDSEKTNLDLAQGAMVGYKLDGGKANYGWGYIYTIYYYYTGYANLDELNQVCVTDNEENYNIEKNF